MKYEFSDEAQAEYAEAADYYERVRPGLGSEFALEVEHAIERILDSPDSFQALAGHCRRFRVKRFPYDVIYRTSSDVVQIIAVAHLHRRPGFWKFRIP